MIAGNTLLQPHLPPFRVVVVVVTVAAVVVVTVVEFVAEAVVDTLAGSGIDLVVVMVVIIGLVAVMVFALSAPETGIVVPGVVVGAEVVFADQPAGTVAEMVMVVMVPAAVPVRIRSPASSSASQALASPVLLVLEAVHLRSASVR